MLYILNIVLKMKQCFGKLKVDDDHILPVEFLDDYFTMLKCENTSFSWK